MFLHDAQERTESWQRRHSAESIAQLGVWRWRGIEANAETIKRECDGKRVIDFGGSMGPLGLNSIIVDYEDPDHQQITDVPDTVDVIFSSHTIEHCQDLNTTLNAMRDKLILGGSLILHVPAWTCERWRAGAYNNPPQTPHLWTFCLWPDIDKCFPMPIPLDMYLCGVGFAIEQREYCGDDSIFIMARKV